MKIHQVTMTGFGPYRGTETVDFDAFDDDGIFLITGRTGAGKTSILDAITFALYGSIPRYDGTAGEKVRSDYIGPTDLCEVTLEFSAGDTRYRVVRSPAYQRPKRRGEGTTTEPPRFELARLVAGTWEVTEAKVGNAEVHVEEIVRLNAKQFLQVILLAQGQFQEFLVASSDKRRDLLRMLFDTKRFSDYGEALDDRARTLRAQLQASSTAIGTNSSSLARVDSSPVPDTVDLDSGSGVAEWVETVLRRHADVAEAAAVDLADAQSRLESARQAFDAARTISDRQDRRDKTIARQDELRARRAEIEHARTTLADSRRAAMVWHLVETSRAAAVAREEAQERRLTAAEAFHGLLPDEPADAESLDALVHRSTELLGSLREAAEKESGLDSLAVAALQGSDALVSFDVESARRVESRTSLRTERETLGASLPALEVAAAGLGGVEQQLTLVRSQLASARAAEKTVDEIDRAEEARLVAGRDVTAASAARDSVRERQHTGFAGVLAQELESGQPCPVCGSATHPAPAALADDHVDDAAVESAETAYELAVRRSNEADGLVTQLLARVESERAAADGQTVEELLLQEKQADLAKVRALASVDELAAAKQAHEQLTLQIDRLTEEIESSQARRQALVSEAATAKERHDEAVRSLAAARGSHATVADRVDEITSHIGAARVLLEAGTALRESVDRASAADDALATALVEHELDDVAAAEAAHLPAAEQKRLQEQVDAHDVESKAVASALRSDDLADLPDDAIDLVAPHAAFTEADAHHNQVIAVASAAQQKQSTVIGLAAEIHTALDAAADLRSAYDVVHRLASTVRGQTPNTMKMMLETFVLAAELEEIVLAANTRLTSMTDGRYEFLHSDAMAKGGAQSGLALEVLDAYTGDTRAPQSLSGGEKFQASLALALGLAEVLTSRAGGIRLDTLFIDEGFGSLDADTLETTMATLDNLREGGRTIGLISHVGAMKESIPAQLFVDSTDGGWSTIRTS